MKIRWMAKNLKNRIVLSAGIVSYMILLFMRIPLSRVIGDAGVGLFAPALELFLLTALVTSYGMSRALAGIMRYRVKRERYRNARKVFRTGFFMNIFLGAVMALMLLFFSAWIADVLVLEHLCRMALLAAAPAVFLSALTGSFRGYFNGYGMGVLVAHSLYIEKIALFIGAMFGGRTCYTYGLKVAALKQTEAHAYAYGAAGAVLGLLFSQIVTLLYLMFVYIIYAGSMRGRPGQDSSRRAETQFEIQRMLLSNLVPLAVVVLLSNLFMLVDQRFLNYCMNVTEQGDIRTAIWGSYYGKFAVLIGLGAGLSCLFVHGLIGKISSAYEREEYRGMRERTGQAVRNGAMVSFPTAIYLAVLAKPLSACCYGKATAQVSVLTGWLQKGTILIVLFTFSFLFGKLLYKLHMVRELFFAVAASFAVHLVTAYFLIQRAHMGVEGLLCSLILFFGIYMAASFAFFNRRVKYRPDWLAGVVFPFAASAVSGVIVYLIKLVLSDIAGDGITILAALIVGVFFHILLLMLLRVIGEAELHEMPCGGLFILIGRSVGVL